MIVWMIWPEHRRMSSEAVIRMAEDAIANGEGDPSKFDESVNSAIDILHDAGLATFAPKGVTPRKSSVDYAEEILDQEE